ncbi:hypothetical protein K7432_002203 [Basidiobolus ranarum]|uniref:RGS domain-containing protein n=1 Tax=Basidiobolus ranarum TaxID=34480 RepID=A0ABR2W880_9FUNG
MDNNTDGGWNTLQKIYYPLTIAWNFILISTTILFIMQHDSPAIRYRSITLSVFMVIGNSLVTTLYLGREPTYDQFPCFVNIWVSSVGMPLWLTAVAGRFARLAFLYHFSQAKLVAGQGSQNSNDHYIDITPKEKMTSSPTLVLDQSWYYKHREKFTTKYIVKLISGALALQLALTLLVQAFTTKFQITPTIALGNCLVGWEFIPIYLTSAFYVFVLCPLFISWLRGVNDAYGIKRELMADFTLGVIAFMLYVVFAALPALKDVIRLFPAAHWSVVALMISHVFSIILPTIDAIRGTDRQSSNSSMASFESMLEDPQQFEIFKRFSLRDFSVENALFYEQMMRLRVACNDLKAEKDEMSVDVLLEINMIYNKFIAADAEFELNLEAVTVREIRRRFQTKDISPDVFDRALIEVRNLMFRYTYPRFIKLGQKSLQETDF